MPDPLLLLLQMIVEKLREHPQADLTALVASLRDAIAAAPDLVAALQTDPRVVQINRGDATAFQTSVEGGIANIGLHLYGVDATTLTRVLERVLREQPSSTNPKNPTNFSKIPEPQSGPLAIRLRAMRQGLARYWYRLVSWLTVIFVMLNVLKALELGGMPVPGVTGRPWPMVLGLGLLSLMRFQRLRIWLTRLILGPPQVPPTLPGLFRGMRPYTVDGNQLCEIGPHLLATLKPPGVGGSTCSPAVAPGAGSSVYNAQSDSHGR